MSGWIYLEEEWETSQRKKISSDPWVWALLSLECNYAHFI